MNNATLEELSRELSLEIIGRDFTNLFQVSKSAIALDFRLPGRKLLLISVNPASPRIYLTEKIRPKSAEGMNHLSQFALFLRKHLHRATVTQIEKFPNERILKFQFSGSTEFEKQKDRFLLIQLTGRSSNLFLVDEDKKILARLRDSNLQKTGDTFTPPETSEKQTTEEGVFPKGKFKTLCEALADHYLRKDAEREYERKIASARQKLRKEIADRHKLQVKLKADLEKHGDADKWKRFGDLILANLSSAKIVGNKISLVDLFDEKAPRVEIDRVENLSLTETAENFFRRYAKSRNAKIEISRRLSEIESEINSLEKRQRELEKAIEERDEGTIDRFLVPKPKVQTKSQKDSEANSFRGARRFISSDGWEILVGKGAKDNDFLTFRIAKSLDWWFHAADYAGSHVVVRNPNRKELPQKTFLEAAQLAAFFSQAKDHPKAAVHYTQKKFLNKPRGGAPGLVSLSSFKTILVKPKRALPQV